MCFAVGFCGRSDHLDLVALEGLTLFQRGVLSRLPHDALEQEQQGEKRNKSRARPEGPAHQEARFGTR